ncbi:hypothetical protein GCM10027199_60400 [Amycolatopsis magusensis]
MLVPVPGPNQAGHRPYVAGPARVRFVTGRFSALLRQLRLQAGLTQEQLAERAEVGIRTIRGFETGERANPRVFTVRRLADALGAKPVERDELLAAAVNAEAAETVEAPAGPVPRQLPAPPGRFVGRRRELDHLTATLDGAAAEGATVVVSAISGGGGVGKTWLALHWAHQHLADFPDGQLFVDLRGFAPSGRPMTSGEAIRGLLEALGVQPAAIPADPDAQAGLYRSLVAGRRMLIVLDNARDSHQVAPLLPGGPACTVVVTSRDRLAGLVIAHDTRPITLDLLSEVDARDLLRTRLGEQRLAAEPEATADLLASCAGLPLALAVVAARGALRPDIPLAALAAELRDAATRLGALDADDPAASVRAAVSWTHAALEPEQAELFASLGLAPGPDIGLPAAACLAGLPVERVAQALRRLERISLLEEHTAGRFRMHDLVRLYATERAHQDLSPGTPSAALRRLAEFYLHTSYAADRLLSPQRQPIELPEPDEACPPQRLADQGAAWAWFDAEHTNLLATHHLAVDRGWHALIWRLAWALQSFRWRRGLLDENVSMWRAGLLAAERSGDPAAQILAHRLLARAYVLTGLRADASQHIRRSLSLAEAAGDVLAQANAHHGFTLIWSGQDARRAVKHALAALELYRSIGYRVGEADALNTAGWHEAHLGEYDQARAHCEAALVLHREQQDRFGECLTVDSLGYIALHSGRHAEARDHYEQAILLHRGNGNTYAEPDALESLARTEVLLDRPEKARAALERALDLYESQHRDEEAGRVRVALGSLS